MERLTKKQILDQVITKYGRYPELRGYDENRNHCVYLSPDGKRCGVGQYSISKALDEAYCEVHNLSEHEDIVLDEHLSEHVRGHEIDFWSDIQGIHDTVFNTEPRAKEYYGRIWLAEEMPDLLRFIYKKWTGEEWDESMLQAKVPNRIIESAELL